MKTGQISDYLEYKRNPTSEEAINSKESTGINKDAGICSINRDSNKSRTNR